MKFRKALLTATALTLGGCGSAMHVGDCKAPQAGLRVWENSCVIRASKPALSPAQAAPRSVTAVEMVAQNLGLGNLPAQDACTQGDEAHARLDERYGLQDGARNIPTSDAESLKYERAQVDAAMRAEGCAL